MKIIIKNKYLLLMITILLSLIFSSCVALNDKNSIRDHVEVIHDDFSKSTLVYGPRFTAYMGLFDSSGCRLVYEKTSGVVLIYFDSFSQTGWKFYQSAFDSNGNRLKFVKIDTNVLSSTTYEDFALKTDYTYLLKNKDTGIKLKVYGKRGNFVVELSPQYIQGFLEAVD